MIALVLDGLLACVLPIIAWRALAAGDVHEAVVLFISLGLLSAVAWARLDAPDIALVEAAVGAGVTGALLVTTLRAMGPEHSAPAVGRAPRIVLSVLAVVGAIGIVAAVTTLPITAGLGDEVRASLHETGARHPVTAVLLDLRGYDTLLEVAVLLVAVLAARSRMAPTAAYDDERGRPLFAVLVRLLVPGILLVAGYLLWRGAVAPGGAFQAAAVLAGGGILAIVSGIVRSPDPRAVSVRVALVLGPTVFLVIAAVPLLAGAQMLDYPEGWAKALVLVIELALTFSIALVLVLFLPGAPRRHREPAEARG